MHTEAVLAAGLLLNLPAGQEVQAVLPVERELYVPAAQVVQVVGFWVVE